MKQNLFNKQLKALIGTIILLYYNNYEIKLGKHTQNVNLSVLQMSAFNSCNFSLVNSFDKPKFCITRT